MEKIKDFFYSYWKILLVLTITIFSLVFVIYYYYFYDKDNNLNNETVSYENENIEIDNDETDSNSDNNDLLTDSSTEVNSKTIYIDIKGEVVNPGIYQMNNDNRVIDAINMAGGLTIYANTSVNNLSMKLKDEMVIVIYSNDQVNDFAKTKADEYIMQESCKNYNNITNDSCITSTNDLALDNEKININTASKEQLLTITGIGEAKALAIINYREENGLFTTTYDITNVSGIGDSVYEKIKDYITI